MIVRQSLRMRTVSVLRAETELPRNSAPLENYGFDDEANRTIPIQPPMSSGTCLQ
jgi:hypothetical protein